MLNHDQTLWECIAVKFHLKNTQTYTETPFVVLESSPAHACMVLTHKAHPFIWQHNFLHLILCFYLVYVKESLLRMYLARKFFVIGFLPIK